MTSVFARILCVYIIFRHVRIVYNLTKRLVVDRSRRTYMYIYREKEREKSVNIYIYILFQFRPTNIDRFSQRAQ